MTTAIPPLKPYKAFDPDHPGRIGPACRDIATIVADGEWHSWSAIVEEVSAANDLLPKTVSNLLHSMVGYGDLQRSGKYTERCRSRQVRLSGRWL